MYSSCGDVLTFGDTVVELGSTTLEVVVPQGVIVSANTTLFQCASGAVFVDAFGGLYGPNGSYYMVFPLTWSYASTCTSRCVF